MITRKVLQTLHNLHTCRIKGSLRYFAGHAKWQNVLHRKSAQDKKKSIRLVKASRQITVAVRLGGGPDPQSNSWLSNAVAVAREAGMSKDRIQAAIELGAGSDRNKDGVCHEEVMYEARCPRGIALLIDTFTTNRKRTVPELRRVLREADGALCSPGEVRRMFTQVGRLTIDYKSGSADSVINGLMELAIDLGALHVETYNDDDVDGESEEAENCSRVLEIHVPSKSLFETRRQLETQLPAHCSFQACELSWIPEPSLCVSLKELQSNESDQQVAENTVKLIQELDELTDVQGVHHNLAFDSIQKHREGAL
mmetsp:Transcript_14394/g.38539  ORF Transcript_14394/g.38539 Transcript_14394/m.38539 type:complete len:311 (+) Transcript_14394:346-1278(+)